MTGKQRLRVLAKYLVSGAVDDEKFNMCRWPTCAIGEGSRLPALQKEGLEIIDAEPAYEGEVGIDACANFFHIPHSVAHKFFTEGLSRKAVTVGRQLLNYVARH